MANKSTKFINRELSWLQFNQRVMNEALDTSLPLLERLKFLSIVASNLDEFFMVRVGGLYLMAKEGTRKKDIAGMTPLQQIRTISTRAHAMVEQQYRCYNDEVEPGLKKAGFCRISPAAFSKAQSAYIEQYFERELFPLLSPIALREEKRFPLLVNTKLALVCRMRTEDNDEEHKYAIVPIANSMPRFITLPSTSGFFFTLVEDLVKKYIERLFPGEYIYEVSAFRITRNADLAVREDQAADLLDEMKDVLSARKKSSAVRLEIDSRATRIVCENLRKRLELSSRDVYLIPGPLNLANCMELSTQEGFEELKIDPWPPQPTPEIDANPSIFDAIKEQDILLHHPYDHIDPVLRLMQESAKDPNVLAIKQTLYRTSRNSPIVAALSEAARRGKYVTALVELKARFDEEQNIGWAEQLEEDGVQVVYGVRGLKTHAKLTIVVRREPEGIVRYLHFGTGNYNEKTAKRYTDIGYMTCSEDLALDASAFMNAITGYSQPQNYQKISSAPLGLRDRVVTLIGEEIERQKQGQKGLIVAKMNSLSDPAIIEELYRASCNGVRIKLNVRGICCLRPGVKDQSENITVASIVDRFLEHSRIYYFHHGGDSQVFIASADWMPRNLDKRVELMTPVEEPHCKSRLTDILHAYFKDRRKAWTLLHNGEYIRHNIVNQQKPLSSQEYFHQDAKVRIKEKKRLSGTSFEPRRPRN